MVVCAFPQGSAAPAVAVEVGAELAGGVWKGLVLAGAGAVVLPAQGSKFNWSPLLLAAAVEGAALLRDTRSPNPPSACLGA